MLLKDLFQVGLNEPSSFLLPGGKIHYSTRLKRLIASMMDLPLMSVRAAGIPFMSALSSSIILEVLAPSAALPVMAVTILSMWAALCAPEASSVHEPASEHSSVHKFASEASPIH